MKHKAIEKWTQAREALFPEEMVRKAVVCGGYFGTGLLAAQASVFGETHPFSASLLAAVPYPYLWLTFLGSMAGCLLRGLSSAQLRYLLVFGMMLAVRWVFNDLERLKRNPWTPSLMAAVPVLASGIVLEGFDRMTVEQLLFLLAETLLSAGGAYFFAIVVTILAEKRIPFQPDLGELVAISLAGGVILLGLSSFSVGILLPGHIVAVVLILLCAQYGGVAAGGISGTVCGAVLSLGNPGEGQILVAGAFALAGLFAGVFCHMGKFSGTVAFILTNAICCFAGNVTSATVLGLLEITAGSVLFMLLPERWTKGLSAWFADGREDAQSGGLRHSIAMRLDFSAKALRQMSDSVREVSDKLEKMHPPTLSDVYQRAGERVCKNCVRRNLCWNASYDRTMDAFNNLTPSLQKYHRVSMEHFPVEFSYQCGKIALLLRAINEEYENFLLNESAEQRLTELRAAVNVQFNGISDMLEDLAGEYENVRYFEKEAEERIGEMLQEAKIQGTEISCWTDRWNRKTVELRGNAADRATVTQPSILQKISEICDRKFSAPCLTTALETYRLVLSQQTVLTARVGASRHICQGNQLCGDSYDWFYDGWGRMVCVISDGMGSGGRAAVDSSMASALLAKLVKAGMSFACALKIINSMIMVRTGDETLATLDVLCIDLTTGKGECLKAGAPVTFLRHKGEVRKVTFPSLPAGILQDITFGSEKFQLSCGDLVLMVSDGALCDGEDWIAEELARWKGGASSMKLLSETILARAQQRRSDQHDDDITALAVAIC